MYLCLQQKTANKGILFHYTLPAKFLGHTLFMYTLCVFHRVPCFTSECLCCVFSLTILSARYTRQEWYLYDIKVNNYVHVSRANQFEYYLSRTNILDVPIKCATGRIMVPRTRDLIRIGLLCLWKYMEGPYCFYHLYCVLYTDIVYTKLSLEEGWMCAWLVLPNIGDHCGKR